MSAPHALLSHTANTINGDELPETDSAKALDRSRSQVNSAQSIPIQQARYASYDAIPPPECPLGIADSLADRQATSRAIFPRRENSALSPQRCTLSAQRPDTTERYIAESTSDTLHTAKLSFLNLRDVRYGRIDLLAPWFPMADPSHPRARTWRTWHSRQDVLLISAMTTSLAVLLANAVATIYAYATYGSIKGVIPMYEGSCAWVKNADSLLHVIINILSTLLLGASNLCMQVLVSPTRTEIDAAHLRHRWLDIGVPSWRNLANISTSRRATWWCLGLSSIPLHFIYNSAISSSVASYSYGSAVVTESFLRGADWGNASAYYAQHFAWPEGYTWNNTEALIKMQKVAPDGYTLTNLSKAECIDIYTNLYADRSNVMVVLEDGPTMFNSSLLEWVYRPASWDHTNLGWLCFDGINGGPFCTLTSRNIKSNFDNWRKFDRPVLYCLSERKPRQHCRLNYSPPIFAAVCCLSAIKCLCVVFTAWYFCKQNQVPICTLGDAMSSFLERPDPQTSKIGVITTNQLGQKSFWTTEARPILWVPNKRRWFSSASRRRWSLSMCICSTSIVVAIYTMLAGAHGTMHRIQTNSFWSTMRLGFGTAQPSAFTAYFLPRTGSKGFLLNVIWANVWQMIISMLYLTYNGLLTCMLVNEEWSGYSTERKTLRVSHPQGIQRSSYFISMPMKYGVPLMIANATLHWLVSQSIFVVNTTTYYPNDIEDTSQDFVTTGYSTKASFVAICFGVFMLALLILNSLRSLLSGMPLICTSSAAISAACHRPKADREAHLLPVQWGVSTDTEDKHCCLTTDRNVRPPSDGGFVIGISSDMENESSAIPGYQIRQTLSTWKLTLVVNLRRVVKRKKDKI